MKRFLSIFLSIAIIATILAVPIFADNMTTVTVASIEEAKTAGDEVKLEVSIANNPGFTNFDWTFGYNADCLELKDFDIPLEQYGPVEISPLYPLMTAYYVETGKINGSSSSVCTTNGTLFYLIFEVKENAPSGETNVWIETNNANFKNYPDVIEVNYVAGIVNIDGVDIPTGDIPTGDIPTGDIPTGDIPTGDIPTGDIPTGDIPTGDIPTGDIPTGDIPTGDIPTGDIPTGDIPTGDIPTGDIPTGDIPTGDIPTGDIPTGDIPTGDIPTGDIPTGDIPTGDIPTGDIPTGGTSIGRVVSYTVKFETNGAGSIESQKLQDKETVNRPKDPKKEGYVFGGWYLDKKFTQLYDFDTPVTKSFTLYAKWIEASEEPAKTEFFTDVDENDWFYDAVKYAYEKKLINGISETEFAPNVILKRAEFVSILYRLEGEPATNKSIPYQDVDMGAYYANAVSWAHQNEIVKGISETEFAPNLNITREQLITMFCRYLKYKGYDLTVGEDTNILSYTDADEISEYAISAIQHAVGSGLIKGKTDSTLNPKDNTTRAELVQILYNFSK